VDDADAWTSGLGRLVQQSFQRAPVGMLGLVATVLSQEEQIFLENILHGKGPGSRLARRIKTTRLKHKPYRNFPLAPNTGFVFAALRKNALAQIANRTKMLHGNILVRLAQIDPVRAPSFDPHGGVGYKSL
jgi:hypothetical protein